MKKTKLAIALLISLFPLLIPTPVHAESPLIEERTPYEEPAWTITANYEIADELYATWQAEQKLIQINKNPSVRTCSCVNFAKWKSGINVGSIGLARNHPINHTTPAIGAIVVTSESPSGHLAVVIGFTAATLTVTEANYIPCRVGTRTLPLNSPAIRGYYY